MDEEWYLEPCRGDYRGCGGQTSAPVRYTLRLGGWLPGDGVEVTAQQAGRIVGGEDPRDVLHEALPACGYWLHAVIDPLLLGKA